MNVLCWQGHDSLHVTIYTKTQINLCDINWDPKSKMVLTEHNNNYVYKRFIPIYTHDIFTPLLLLSWIVLILLLKIIPNKTTSLWLHDTKIFYMFSSKILFYIQKYFYPNILEIFLPRILLKYSYQEYY